LRNAFPPEEVALETLYIDELIWKRRKRNFRSCGSCI